MTQVTSNRGPSGAYTYHPNFQLSSLTYSNGVTGTFDQGNNGLSRPTRLTYTKGGTTLFDTDHHRYDGAGNIYEIGADRYTYDQTNRLTWGTVTQAGSRWETFTYDAFDNLTSGQKETSAVVQFPVNTSTNRYKGGSDDMVYDSTGNLVQLGAPTWTMAWDAFDVQTRFTSLAAPQSNHLYAYGPGDYRLVTLDTDRQEITYHLRDTDGTLLREYSLTGTGSAETWSRWEHEKDLLHGPEGALATITRTGTHHFLHKDHLGSVRALSDGGGALRGRSDFYPFGQETPRMGQADEPTVKFTGHLRDAHGLSDYMLGRTCLWPLRRFASVDPARDGWNLYAYVGNNPINRIDPDGYFADALLDASFLLLDAVIAGYEYATTGEVSAVTKAAIVADATMLLTPGGTGGGLAVRFAHATAETTQAVQSVNATRQAGQATQMALKTGQVSNAVQSSGGGGGRSANKLKPAPDAQGAHSTFKTDEAGSTTGYAEWQPNSQNPSGFDEAKRLDLKGEPHFNKVTKQDVPTPHVQAKNIPGRVRPARPDKIPYGGTQ